MCSKRSKIEQGALDHKFLYLFAQLFASFFFQEEDGIRDGTVTGVQTCALPICHGPHRPTLEQLAASLGVTEAVIWAGYHEDDLAEHYRAADVLLFTAAGSDEGHRAVIEAMGCGVIPVTYPLPGLDAILGPLAPATMARGGNPEDLALQVGRVLGDHTAELRRRAYDRSHEFGYARAAKRLSDVYLALF